MKTIRVVAAVICSSLKRKEYVLATVRGYGDYKGMWEFPGGKIESGETPKQAVVREIKEELDVAIAVGDFLQTIEYDYPGFHLSMDCFWCEIIDGQPLAKEALEIKWLKKNEIDDLIWLPADLVIIPRIKALMIDS